jgi:Mg/Co/Ni transporter MgtE
MMDYTPKHQSGEVFMPRMTITLSEERQQALKEAAARRGMTITAVIDESLELAGVVPRHNVWAILEEARRNANMTEEEAMEVALKAVAEVRAARRK